VAVPQLRDKALDLFTAVTGRTELVGSGDIQFLVAASAATEVHKCTPQRELADEQCDELRFMIIDAARMPFIATSPWPGRPANLVC
jgi:hypothetical protein